MQRVRFDLAYDGTDFAGWAKQPGLRTCQGELERALATVCQAPIALTVAGRTDAGVHASGQVAHADLPDGFTVDSGLASRLSKLAAPEGDLVVHAAALAPPGFDARFSASGRRYEYRIQCGVRDPLTRRTTVFEPRDLPIGHLESAAGMLVGLRDFAAFCKPRDGATTIRELRAFTWRAEGQLRIAELEADAFCHSMVRSLVGACVAVALGRLNLVAVAELLNERARSNRFAMLPASGLTLTAVDYPSDAKLAAQADRTRARRSAADLAP